MGWAADVGELEPLPNRRIEEQLPRLEPELAFHARRVEAGLAVDHAHVGERTQGTEHQAGGQAAALCLRVDDGLRLVEVASGVPRLFHDRGMREHERRRCVRRDGAIPVARRCHASCQAR